MRVPPSPTTQTTFLASLAFLLAVSSSAFALNLEEIRSTPELTPRKFAALFRDFEFKFHREVQSPEVFLATRSGDCDDFSTLAAALLRERGYTPRLITVRMPGVTHVVCYIEETKSYLDYNNRGFFDRMVNSGPGIDAIAESVARSYKMNWASASEFTYEDGMKRLVQTVMPVKKTNKSIAALFR
jgi:hypothetical protein